MAVLVFTSAKGSPGVTTTTLALTMVWPRPVLLIEADVTGGSSILAGWLRATIPHDRSVVDAALAHRNGELAARLHNLTIPIPPDNEGSTKRLLPAIPRAVHAASVEPVWQPLAQLAASLEEAGTDVIIDAGRIGAQHGPTALLRNADAVVLVARPTLPGITAVAAVLDPLKEDLTLHGQGSDTLALLPIGQPGPGPSGTLYSPQEIRKALNTPVLAPLSSDPVAAEVFSRGAQPSRKFERSGLLRSARTVADAVAHLAQQHLDRIGIERAGTHLSAPNGGA